MNPTLNIVGFVAPGGAEIVVILLISLISLIPIAILFRLAKFATKVKREQLLTRLELGKMADEIQKMKDELQGSSSKMKDTKAQ